MEKYYLAIDIGASSGRHMLGHLENGKMVLEEIHRFPNGMAEVNGDKVWDLDQLFKEIKTGMKKCKELGKIPYSVGIDTWAVDYVLLDKDGKRVGISAAYRSDRTRGMDEEVYKIIPEKELYGRNGIQKQMFNTIYQLMSVKKQHPEWLSEAETMLMIPDYFHYLLTGVKVTEYTNATTTQLISPVTKQWDEELIRKLGYPQHLFTKIEQPGTHIGVLKKELQDEIGYNCKVVLPATHDTGSAVMAVPSNQEDVLYISSGTWSLMGTELKEAICTEESRRKNLTNEGGYNYRFRYLMNIMGLWMIQSVRKEFTPEMSFGEICELASNCDIKSLVDCNDDRFLAPDNMTEEVKKACLESGQQIPAGIAEIAAVIYNSLAKCYAETIQKIQEMTGKTYECIHIVGGGSNADYLNRLTARAAGIPVYAGPTEATAIGNMAAQMLAAGELENLKAARKCIFESFEIKKYQQ